MKVEGKKLYHRQLPRIQRQILRVLSHMQILASIFTYAYLCGNKDGDTRKGPRTWRGQEGRGIKHMRYESGRDEYAGGRKIQAWRGKRTVPSI